FGSKSEPVTMESNFDEDSGGSLGDYRGAFIPTAPGTFTFHITGTIRSTPIDESVTSSRTTFPTVVDPETIQSPPKIRSGTYLATPASAHALVLSSDPAAGAVLVAAPSQVLVTFTEAPDPKLSSLQLLDSSGATVKTGPAQTVPGHPTELVLPLPSLPQGAYTVAWRTVSRVDGHVTGGSFSFGIGVPALTTGQQGTTNQTRSTPVRPLSVVGTWALAWGLILLVGAGVVGSFVTRRL